jgi:2-methylcitrate dehydratase PrpD
LRRPSPSSLGERHHDAALCGLRHPAAGARGIRAEDIASVTCETAEGILHRLWEPLSSKQAPPNAYAAKFSVPYGVAAGLILAMPGSTPSRRSACRIPRCARLCARVSYEVDPANPIRAPTPGHVRATLRDGTVVEERQANLRGGAADPLSRAEIEARRGENCSTAAGTRRGPMRWSPSAPRAFDLPRSTSSPFRG